MDFAVPAALLCHRGLLDDRYNIVVIVTAPGTYLAVLF